MHFQKIIIQLSLSLLIGLAGIQSSMAQSKKNQLLLVM